MGAGWGVSQEGAEGGFEVGTGWPGTGLEGAFREDAGVEDHADGGWRSGDDAGLQGGAAYVIEGEACAVRRPVGCGAGIWDRREVAGGDAGLEDQVAVGFGDASAVVQDGEVPVAASPEDGSNVDVAGSGVAGVAHQLPEDILDGVDARGNPPGALGARQAGEAGAKIPVRSLQQSAPPLPAYFATSLTRLSRITVTLIWPGYSRSCSICLEMSRASLAAMRSSTSEGWTITLTSRPAWMA